MVQSNSLCFFSSQCVRKLDKQHSRLHNSCYVVWVKMMVQLPAGWPCLSQTHIVTLEGQLRQPLAPSEWTTFTLISKNQHQSKYLPAGKEGTHWCHWSVGEQWSPAHPGCRRCCTNQGSPCRRTPGWISHEHFLKTLFLLSHNYQQVIGEVPLVPNYQ